MKQSNDEYILPYRDQRLESRFQEEWADIPGLVGLFMVSNHGRIMRLGRVGYDAIGRKFTTFQKIMLPAINRSPNIVKKDYTYRFQIQAQIKTKMHSFQVQRIVYYCFVEPFDLHDRRINIIVKEGNGLNIRPENLLKVSLEEKVQRSYSSGRQLATLDYNPEYKIHAISASTAITGKQISRYDLDGKIVERYNTQMEASAATGITRGRILAAIKFKWLSPGGFYWRLGKVEMITIIERPKKDLRATRGKSVTKFDLNGNPLAVYAALSEAARENNISHKGISLNIKGINSHAGGFIWKLGNHYESKTG